MPITTTFIVSTSPSVVINTGSTVTNLLATWRPVGGQGQFTISNTVSSYLVNQISGLYSQGSQGYGLGNYYTLPVSSSTRVTAKQFNRMLSDVDLVYRHITSASVVSTTTNLSTWTNSLTVTVTNLVSASSWIALTRALDSVVLNRYNLHPGQLVGDGRCTVIYDQGLDVRTMTWGTSTDRSVSVRMEVEWPKSYLANSFFNLGGQFTFTPYVASMGLQTTGTAQTVQFKMAHINAYVSVPLSVNSVGLGRGPVYQVGYDVYPTGSARTEDFFYGLGQGVSSDLALLGSSNDPRIPGTPFQFLGLHYGDYTTKLIIAVQQGQSVPLTSTRLEFRLNSGSQIYSVVVPGALDRYTGSTVGLTGLNGWWIQDLDLDGVPYDRQISWIDVWTGRKGPDPIGLQAAVVQYPPQTNSLTITASGAGGVSSGLKISETVSGSTVTNAWAQFIKTIQLTRPFVYTRDQWFTATGAISTTYSTGTTTNGLSATIAISAVRDSGAGISRRLVFALTATNYATSSTIIWDNDGAYAYLTSSFTCSTAVSNVGLYTEPVITTQPPADWYYDPFSTGGGGVDGDGGGGSGGAGAGGAGAAGCFIPDALVTMADLTQKPMRDIRLGDQVQGHGQINTVTKIWKKTLDSRLVGINGGANFVSESHPILTSFGWGAFDPRALARVDPELHARFILEQGTVIKISLGHKLITGGRSITVSSIDLKELGPIEVYLLGVDGNDTYLVENLVVHNKAE